MNIGLGVRDLTISGGTQRQVIELARGLLAQGHAVTLYCCDLNRDRCYPDRLAGLSIIALREGVTAVETASAHPSWPGRAAYYARRYRAQRADALSLAERMDPATDLFNAHDHDAGWLGDRVRRRLGIPTVWMINDLPRSFFPRSGPVAAALGRAALGWNVNILERRIARGYDRLIVLDRRNQALVRAATGVEATVVRSGLDLAACTFRPREAPPAGRPLALLCVGALFPWRRYEDAIAALAPLAVAGRAARLTIVGHRGRAPAYAARLERLAAGAAGPVTLTGDLPEPALREAIAAADVFLFPASPQTWGLTVFEAMAAGTPAVVSRGAGASEVLVDRDTAMLVNPGRPAALAAAISALAADPALYAGLSLKGRRFVETTLSWERYAADMGALFATLRR